jgi:Putative metallopeptidase
VEAKECSDLVCMSAANATAIWTYAREVTRYEERVNACYPVDAAWQGSPGQVLVDRVGFAIATVSETIKAFPMLTIEVEWAVCGGANAFYFPSMRKLGVCIEMLSMPKGVFEFVIAHEMAHAFIWQTDVPYTGSGEEAADELAAIYLIAHQKEQALKDTAKLLAAEADGRAMRPSAEHPENGRRAYVLSCLANPNYSAEYGCSERLKRVVRSWGRLVKL